MFMTIPHDYNAPRTLTRGRKRWRCEKKDGDGGRKVVLNIKNRTILKRRNVINSKNVEKKALYRL